MKLKIGIGVFLLVILGIASCQGVKTPTDPEEKGTNVAAVVSRNMLPPDSVTFDVFLIHVGYQDRELVRELWQDVDEQEQNWEIRQKLREHGFRSGILGATIPDSLSKLLTLKGRPLRTTLEEEVSLDQEDTTAAVSKPVTLQDGRKSLIAVRDQRDIIASVPVLENDDGQLVGKTYENASPLLMVSIRNIPDGSVQFELTPILRFGEAQTVTKYKHAQLFRTQEQPTRTFDNLKSYHSLRPGQFMVMGVSDENTKGLGRYFFTKGSDDLEQKIMLIRLLVTQHDEQFRRFPGFQDILAKTSYNESVNTSEEIVDEMSNEIPNGINEKKE